MLVGIERNTDRRVLSDADLEIDLNTLVGALRFTKMEAWISGDTVAVGTGEVWSDGDLSYTVLVSGNSFVQAGGDDGDAGHVAGAFFGTQHEGMGGTLERDDLTAAFGGAVVSPSQTVD